MVTRRITIVRPEGFGDGIFLRPQVFHSSFPAKTMNIFKYEFFHISNLHILNPGNYHCIQHYNRVYVIKTRVRGGQVFVVLSD